MLYMPLPYSVPMPAINSPTLGKEVGKRKMGKDEKMENGMDLGRDGNKTEISEAK